VKIVTIYDHPFDAPDGFAVRYWDVEPGKVLPGKLVTSFPTLEAAREHVPRGLVNIGRTPEDDPKVVEVWV
jgi:hypothetical protein